MTSNDSPAPAGKGGMKGFVAIAAVLVIIPAMFIVLPGFVAAGFSRTTVTIFTSSQDGHIVPWGVQDYAGTSAADLARDKAMRWFLIPANGLLLRSSLIRKFYTWEFQAAGGRGAEIIPSGDYIDPNEREEDLPSLPSQPGTGK